ncbi:hypothetical protein L596_007415 [Steinernema carpocapsae]|uniref:Uncharacterized protein n=1 Tax=Steinernema carpocapsae TaxID=34508 RepID=A0A4U5P9D3_STECR|nr:hypothetical protein L596_007415 [Steinernema carpocapsae]
MRGACEPRINKISISKLPRNSCSEIFERVIKTVGPATKGRSAGHVTVGCSDQHATMAKGTNSEQIKESRALGAILQSSSSL